MAWRIAQSLLALLAEVNALYPDRDKGTDGGISGYTYGPGGIVVNPNNQSSHNINSGGVVCAFDITTGNYPGGISVAAGQALAEQIRIRVRDQPRGITFYGIHYMAPPYVAIAGPKICTYGTNWEWEHYRGSDLHTSHQHWSADWDVFPGGAPSGLADYDSTLPWNLTTITTQGSKPTPITPSQEDDMATAEDIADAVWSKEITLKNGEKARAIDHFVNLCEDAQQAVKIDQVLTGTDGTQARVMDIMANLGPDVRAIKTVTDKAKQ